MIIEKERHVEEKLTITETDIVGGGEVLILIAYAIKTNDEMWSYPSPQIFNKVIYEKNKEAYNKAVQDFRNKCEMN